MKSRLLNILIFFLLILPFHLAYSGTIVATKECQYEFLSQIDKVSILESQDKNARIKVFETSGGDPAMNGNIILVNIFEYDNESGVSYTWETGIDMSDVTSIRGRAPNTIIIEGKEDYQPGNSADIQKRNVSYLLNYSYKDGHISNKLDIKRK